MNCRVVGALVMEDDGGGDEKIVAVPSQRLTSRYDNVQNYTDLPSILTQQVEHFFAHYKDIEPNKWATIERWAGVDEAKDMVRDAIARAQSPN